MVTEPKVKKPRNAPPERGPNPAHILLDAISGALNAGMDAGQLQMMVDMARQAYGTDQGTSWKMIAGTLRERSEQLHHLDVHGDYGPDGSTPDGTA